MGRPAFSLSDDQARQLAGHVNALNVACPYDANNHRPFVREFVVAVHLVTGQLFSPTIYRRLLGAYAPERKPSTVTLADERRRLSELLTVASRIDRDEPINAPTNLLHLIRAAMNDALEAAGPAARAGPGVASAELAFLRSRLDEAEAMVRQLRTRALEVATQLAASQQSATQYQEEAQHLHRALDEQATAITVLSTANDDARKFAMLAIDEARGETRVWKERCLILEGQRKSDALLLETFRRAAYRAGSDIPATLHQDKS